MPKLQGIWFDGGFIMDDLISRQAAIKEFDSCETTPDGGIDVNYAIDFLNQLPSVERKKGHWIEEPNCWYRCSLCGSHYVGLTFGLVYPSLRGCMDYNYCPNCGAYMREEKR
jgi:Zn-finger nucleic acid-binding protein